MTLLSVVRNMSTECQVSRPSTVISNTAIEVIELLRASNKAGKYLTRRFNWQILRKEKTFTSVATEIQTSMVPSDYDHFVDETFWNRTRKLPFFGPVTPVEWQQIKVWNSSPVTHTFTYRGGNILVSPVPTAGDTFAYEYGSKNWCQTSGAVAQSEWAADTDTGILDEYLLELGGIVFWKLSKGLATEANLADFDTMVQTAIDVDKPKRVVDMAGGRGATHGIVIPEGNWMQ